ncbi:MAG TPA: hypothetical protein VEW74_09915 [Candidatus Nitrosotalea sp.]|nr:hypothetical protein [Candidatus Nitrosotalea sp.]
MMRRTPAYLTALILAGCAGMAVAPQASAPAGAGWIYAGGVLYHQPHYAPSRGAESKVTPLFFRVPYLGGAVIVAPKYYFTFWGYKKFGDPSKAQPLLEESTKVMGGSAHTNIETQYYQGASGSKVFIQNPKNQYGGSWNDESGVPNKPTDLQVAAEALKAVKHFGYDPNGVYFIATGHKHSEDGFPAHWCSYHSVTYYNKQIVPYSYLPYVPDAGHACGANFVTPPKDESGADEGVTIMAGHEYGEVITDPSPSTAWDGPQGEIGDQCYWHGIANEKFGSKSYTEQPMASDADNACVQTY